MSYWKSGHILQGGKYIIDKVLSVGGCGVTYRAREQSSTQLVAIKTLNAFLQSRPDFATHQESFVQEAFRLAKCSHKNVIRVDDVCKEGELWCMVMEYLSGGTLEELVKAQGLLLEQKALLYIQQIGQALIYIHQQGLLHRDVKPANIMLRENSSEAVLIDFGLARDFSEGRIQTHTNARSESFAPMEQYQMYAKRGAYTDVYALAATLYYLLTAELPVPANFRHQGSNLIPPQQHNPQISDNINQVILMGMALEPQERPQSVQKWLDLLPPVSSLSSQQPQEVQPSSESPFETEPFFRAKVIQTPLVPFMKAKPLQSPVAPSSIKKRHQPPPLPSPEYSLDRIKLVSTVGVDYTPLRDLLASKQWREADRETARLMLQVAGREKKGWLDAKHIYHFPCEDLLTIDQLWVQGSHGRYGFSVQKDIYQSLGGTSQYDPKIWTNFGDRVGWYSNRKWLQSENFTFTSLESKGHLPMLGFEVWGFKGWIAAIAARLTECNLK